MGKMNALLLSHLESDPVFCENYWLNQMIQHHFEPVPPLLSVEEKQPSSNEVTLRIQCEGDEFALPFSVSEFNELCSLRYRLEFAVVGAA